MRQRGRSGQPDKARRVKRPTTRKASTSGSSVGDLQKQVGKLTRELKEANERHTATAEVLQVINSSPGDLGPVFDTILENAMRLCEASHCHVWQFDGRLLHAVAVRGDPSFVEWLQEHNPVPPIPGSAADRIARGEEIDHVADRREEEAYRGDPVFRGLVDAGGVRASLCVALRRGESLLGMINVYRQEVRPFSDQQIALLQNFAAQAVIAMENARLFNELQARTRELSESLQQQTATSGVLEVISRSAFDLQTVFNAVAESAVRLCGADRAFIFRFDGELLRMVVAYNASAEFTEFVRQNPIRPGRQSGSARAALERRTVQIVDVRDDAEYSYGAKEVEAIRTLLGVPILKSDELFGVMMIYRLEIRAFSERQIALVETFANQAAIAIENVRLFEAEQHRTLELAKSLDELRTTQDRLIQTEKLASLGQLTAGIAHEIKNPLNFVNNFSALSVELTDELNEVLTQERLTDKGREEVDELTGLLKDNLDKVVQHGKRADSIVKNMLLHSRQGSGERGSADINTLVGESLNLAYHGARAENAGFSMKLKHDLDPEAGALDLYPQEMTRALLNLISNGFYAAIRRKREAGDETFEPVLSAATRNLGKSVEIRIRDNGTGIPPAVREKMFNPFFTTKPTGEGTGLGLSMTHDIIVKQHGGRIDVETEPGEFTEFIITLPRESASGSKPE
jgi:two-component system NtrC family sensor kinase